MRRIAMLRKEMGMNQMELAKYLRLSQQTISKYENGKADPDKETLIRLSELFNVSTDYIIGNSDKRDHSELTYKDNRNIAKTLDVLKDQIDNNESGELNYNGIEVTDDDAELLMDALDMALRRIKRKNKEKYTPKKYKE
ncbi:MAG: helix-turn-helix transcriptional regulator [Anaerostipes hadrus]|nr:helix-turn-helix transcriptional regulator [Anaerostipes hadrus]